MGWWIGVEIDTGNETVNISDRSVTYNLAPMFTVALNIPAPGVHNDYSCRCKYDDVHERGLRALHGAPCSEAGGTITAAVNRMINDPESYRSLNPSNGWGTYENAVDTLRWLADQCDRHPKAHVYVH